MLCRLGLHKWEDYGDEVQVFWNEPQLLAGTPSVRNDSDVDVKSKVVHSKRQCLRCGMKLKRKFLINPDGTVSVAGWELDNEEIQQKGRKSAAT